MTEKFSKEEKRQIKLKLECYGAIKDCSEKTGIHRSTIQRLLKSGEASQQVANKLRNYVGCLNTKLFIEPSAGFETAA